MKSMIALLALATVAVAQHQGAWNQWNGHDANPPQQKWHGPLALPPGYDKNGAPLPVQDTPEVAAAKAAQISVLARSGGNVPTGHNAWAGAPGAWAGAPAAHGGWNGANQGGWAGAPAAQGGWNGANQGGWAGAPAAHGGWNGANQGGWAGAPAAQASWAAAPGNNNPLWNAHAVPAGVH